MMVFLSRYPRLFLLVRYKIVRLNPFWKASPIIWLLFLNVALLIPMGWGAPSGALLVTRPLSFAIVPDVAGEVIDVPVQPDVPLWTCCFASIRRHSRRRSTPCPRTKLSRRAWRRCPNSPTKPLSPALRCRTTAGRSRSTRSAQMASAQWKRSRRRRFARLQLDTLPISRCAKVRASHRPLWHSFIHASI